jgi:hypothetical protein
MTIDLISPNDDSEDFIKILILNDDVQKFTKTLGLTKKERMAPIQSERLQNAIRSRIQKIITNNPTTASSEAEIIKLLVWDLVDELREGSASKIVLAHWESFLLVAAEEFAKWNKNKIYAQKVSYYDFEDYCLGSIISPTTFINNFFKKFKNYETNEKSLLTRLNSYAMGIIRNLVKARLAKELADSTIGKSDIGLSNRFGRKLTKLALERHYASIDVERYLNLRQCVMGYLEQERKKEQLIPESQLGRNKRIKINKLKPNDLDEIGRLYQVNTDKLSPPIIETLKIIGAAVRYHRQNPPLSEPPSLLSGMDDLIIRMCADSCVYWLSKESRKLEPGNKEILYLHYHCQLSQCEIAPIFNVNQSNISIPLSKIRAGISTHFLEALSEYSSENTSVAGVKSSISRTDAIKSVHTVMKNWFDRFEISKNVNHIFRQELELLLVKYKQYLQCVEELRQQYPELRSALASVNTYSERLKYLSTLNQQDYPKLSESAISLEISIENITKILKELWN